MTLTVELFLPPMGVSPNRESSTHWSKRSNARREYRNEACMVMRGALLKAGWPYNSPVIISATFYAHRGAVPDGKYRPNDKANAIHSLKAPVDGFVDAGLIPDDSHLWVSWGEIELLRNKKVSSGRPRVMVTIQSVDTIFLDPHYDGKDPKKKPLDVFNGSDII